MLLKETELTSCPTSDVDHMFIVKAAWLICWVIILSRPSGVRAHATRQGELNNSKQVKQIIRSHLIES